MGTERAGVTFASLMGLGPQMAVETARLAEACGYRSYWTAETTGPEAFSVLAAAGAAAPSLDLGTGVLALQLRTPMVVAMAGATLQALHPERDILLGVGISSPVVATRWHGQPYTDQPLGQVREYVTLLRACLSGEKVDFAGDHYQVKGFRLGLKQGEKRPKIVVGALNPKMMAMAGELAVGVILNYLPA
jgi:alkanesulfonate monooxygenase SsuD/methylene tetrahydromethanopterin reductase-like flavin-dependent oxidoreductase (luciferase family)